MVALLDEYDFVDGDGASNQHSRVVLLELVIDRLLLLLQSFDFYTQNVRCIQQRAPTPQKGCPSVGAVVKNYWSALLNFVGTADINGPQTKPKGFDCSTTAPPTHPTPLLQPRTEDSGRRSSASSSSASSSSAS
ncbi:coiled-coil domain-containing protein 157-like, partial [Cynoglossus semilaevis]|uniref:coiled-coil domain-containing protein 157-like n=1 Tax=Cynoglossus semilaevis TaxID=244447 RepID=UPI0007DC9B3F